MSAISLKSITGITSITTPAGVDNQLTLHTNNTTERVKIDVAGNVHINNHLAVAGVSTFTGDIDVDGHTNLDNVSIAGVTTASTINFATNARANFASNNRLSIHSNGTNSYFDYAGAVAVRSSGGSSSAISLASNGNVGIIKDLDVGGHTNLDNVSVAGVTTFAGNTYVNDSFTINDTGSSTPLSVLGNFGTGDTVYIQNNTSGGHVQFGLRANDSDGNHHRAYITAEKGTGAQANGKLSIFARRGNGYDFGWIIDAGVGIQANHNVIPETDSTHDIGTTSVRWANVYSDNVNVSGTGTFSDGTFSNDVNVANSIVHIGDTNTSIDYENDKISVKTGGTTRVSVANTGVILDDELYINQTSSGRPLHIEGMLGTTENIHIKNNTSGGHIQIGLRQNDTDGNHHRAYITCSKGTGGVSGKLEIKVRGQGGGTNRGFILDAGVGIQVNQSFLPETDSTYDLGTSSVRWKDIYTDEIDVGAKLTVAGPTDIKHNSNTTINNDRLQLGFNAPEGYIKAKNSTGSPAANIALYTTDTSGNTNKRMHLSYDGKVGINQASPRSSLDVSGYIFSNNGSQIQITGSPGAKGLQIIGQDDGTSLIGTMGSSGEHLLFRTASNERMRLLVGGPHLLLGGTSSVYEITETSSNSGLVIGNTSMTNGGLAIINSTTGTGRIYFGDATSNNAGRNRGMINYHHNGDYMLFATAGSERLRIDSAGNLLIDATSVGNASTYARNIFISGSSNNGITIHTTDTSGTNRKCCLFFGDGTSVADMAKGMLFYDHNGDYLHMSANGGGTGFARSARLNSDGTFRLDSTPTTVNSISLRIQSNKTRTVNDNNGIAFFDEVNHTQAAIYVSKQSTSNGTSDLVFSTSSGQVVSTLQGIPERMRLTSEGYLGLGDSNPEARFHLRDTGTANANGFLFETGTSGVTAKFVIKTTDNGDQSKYLRLSGHWTEVGVHNNEGFRIRNSSNGIAMYVNSGGSYQFYGSNLSDRNLKEDIETISTPTIDLIKQVSPKLFKWKNDINKTQHGGFIAQEMQPLFPKLISGTDYDDSRTDYGDPNEEQGPCNPTGLAFDYDGYTAYLTKAMQELIAKVESLEAEVATLKAK